MFCKIKLPIFQEGNQDKEALVVEIKDEKKKKKSRSKDEEEERRKRRKERREQRKKEEEGKTHRLYMSCFDLQYNLYLNWTAFSKFISDK